MYLGTAQDVELRKAELVALVAGGKQTDNQIRSAELDMIFGISDYIGGGAWTVVDAKSGVRSVALGNMPHSKEFGGEIAKAFNIVEEDIGKKDDGTPKVRRYSQITGKSETMYLLLGKLSHPWVREGFGLVCDEATKSYECSNWYSGFTSNLWAPFVASVKKIAGDKANNGDLKIKALELLKIFQLLTIDKTEQSGNNIDDMKQRVEEFKTAIECSSFADVKIDYQKLSDSPKKSEFLRDVFNDFAERKAKTKKKAAAVESVDFEEIRQELGIDAETDIANVITDMKADAQKYNEISTQFALAVVNVNTTSDEKINETIATLETAHKNLLARAEEISNQINALQNRLAQADQIESIKKSLLAQGIDEQTARNLALLSLTNSTVQKMLANGGDNNGRGSKKPKQDAGGEATK